MAFPTTISGVTFLGVQSQGRSRPIVSSSGAVYMVFRDGTNTDQLSIQKGDPPDTSFTEIATLTITGNPVIDGIGTAQVGDLLHILTADDDENLRYHIFNMATDSFTLSNEDTTATTDNDSERACALALQEDGTTVLAYYAGAEDNVMGPKDRVKSARRSGGTWDNVDSAIDTGGAFDFYLGGLTRGESDLFHLTYKIWDGGATAAGSRHRSLALPTTLSSAESLGASGTSRAENHYVTQPVYYDDDGVEVVTCGFIRSPSRYAASEIIDDGVPSAVEFQDQLADYTGNFLVGVMAVDPEEKTVWAIMTEPDQDMVSDKNVDRGGWGTDVEEIDGITLNLVTSNIYIRGGNVVHAVVYDDGGTIKYTEFVLRSSGVQIDKEASDTVGLEINEAVSDLLGVIDVLDSLDLSISEVTEILGFLNRTETLNLSLGEAVNLLSILERVDTVDLAISDASALVVVLTAIDTLNLAIVELVTDLLGKIDPVDTLDLDLVEPTPEIDVEGTAQDTLDLEVNEGVPDLLGRSSDQDALDLAIVEGPGEVAAGVTAEDDLDLDINEGPTDLLGLIEPVDTTGLTVEEVTEVLSLTERLDTLGISISEVKDLLVLLTRTDILDLVVSEDPGQVVVGLQAEDTLSLAVVETAEILGFLERSDTVGLTIVEGVPLLFVQLNRDDLLNLEINESVGQVNVQVQVTDVLDLAVVEGVGDLLSLIERTDLLDLSLDELADLEIVGVTLITAADILGLQIVEFPADLQIITFEGIIIQPFTLQVVKEARFTLQVRREAQFQLEVRREARFTLQIEGSGVQQP